MPADVGVQSGVGLGGVIKLRQVKRTDTDVERLQQERCKQRAAAGGAQGSIAQPDQNGQ